MEQKPDQQPNALEQATQTLSRLRELGPSKELFAKRPGELTVDWKARCGPILEERDRLVKTLGTLLRRYPWVEEDGIVYHLKIELDARYMKTYDLQLEGPIGDKFSAWIIEKDGTLVMHGFLFLNPTFRILTDRGTI